MVLCINYVAVCNEVVGLLSAYLHNFLVKFFLLVA